MYEGKPNHQFVSTFLSGSTNYHIFHDLYRNEYKAYTRAKRLSDGQYVYYFAAKHKELTELLRIVEQKEQKS